MAAANDTTKRASLLPDDWTEGVPFERDHAELVAIPRLHLLDFQHGDAVRMWESFLDAAEQWKQQHGVEAPWRGLLQIPLSKRKSWQCAGTDVQDPVDLLTEKLIGFEPYDQLEHEHGRTTILAAICLAHVAGAPGTADGDRIRIGYKATIALEKLCPLEPNRKAAAIKELAERVDAIGPSCQLGVKYSRAQAERGRKGLEARWKGNEARNAVTEIITELATSSEFTDVWDDPLPPEELWPELYARMDSKRMNPREYDNPPRYECDGLREPLNKESFKRRIRRIREQRTCQ